MGSQEISATIQKEGRHFTVYTARCLPCNSSELLQCNAAEMALTLHLDLEVIGQKGNAAAGQVQTFPLVVDLIKAVSSSETEWLRCI